MIQAIRLHFLAKFIMSGLLSIITVFSSELALRLPDLRKTRRENLSILVGTMLHVRSANLMDLAAGLPRSATRIDMRYQWITRILGNSGIDPDEIMAPFAREVIARTAAQGGPVVLIMDQSKLSDHYQILMVALRYGERALPLAWRVVETQGGIGFEIQKELLETVKSWLPPELNVSLMGDRFYGTPDLIERCQDYKWDYRLRLKGNNIVYDNNDVKTTTGMLVKNKIHACENVKMTQKKITTSIGIIHDPGHKEPWIIAMPEGPSYLKTLNYSKRWGIEPMFSDFKSRGFGIESTQIQRKDRLSCLILVMALALYTAVSTGQWDEKNNPHPDEKKL